MGKRDLRERRGTDVAANWMDRPVQLAPLLEEARPGLASRCQLLFLPCTDPPRPPPLPGKPAGCQGFVFSNPLLYHAVLHRIPKLERYCGCLSIDECDLYRTLFQVAVGVPPHWTLPRSSSA